MFTVSDIETFISQFEGCSLPKSLWTHQAHLVVGLWYLMHYPPDIALNIVRERIRAYNVAVGTPNTDSSGYHETLTRFFLHGIAATVPSRRVDSLPASVALLLQSPLAQRDWPLQFYSRDRLFSVEARHVWHEPDLMPLTEIQ